MTISNLMLKAQDPILEKIIATIPEPKTESTNDVFFDLIDRKSVV